MSELGRVFEGRPDLRLSFEDILVGASQDTIERFTRMEVLALKVGDQHVSYPTDFKEYPGVLWTFTHGDGLFKGETVTTLVGAPLLARLIDEVLAFYRQNLDDIAKDILENKQRTLSSATRATMSRHLEEIVVDEAFKKSVEEVLGTNFDTAFFTAFKILGVSFVAAIGLGSFFGTSTGLATFGFGACVAAGVVFYQAAMFKDKFKERVCVEVRRGSHSVYEELNNRLYAHIKDII